MKGLLLKDLYMAAKYCRAFLLIVVVFLAVSFFGDDNIFFVVYPAMIAGIVPVTLISYDERDKWDLYAGTLPYTGSQPVSSKYIIGLLFVGVAFFVSLAASAVRMTTEGYFSADELVFTGALLIVMGVIGPAFLLPFVFKFGAEKGRIAFYVMIGLLCALSAFWARSGFPTVFFSENKAVTAAAAGAAVLLYLLSWRLSVLFCRKREL